MHSADSLTIDCYLALIFDLAVIIFDDTTVFTIQFGCGSVDYQLIRLSIVSFLEFVSFLSDFDSIEVPLNGRSKTTRRIKICTKKYETMILIAYFG